jgi:hypothetical protein
MALMHPAADARLWITGQVQGGTTETCLLKLVEDEDVIAERRIPRDFRVSVTIAPNGGRFVVEVNCGAAAFRSATHLVTPTTREVNLGMLTVQ